MKTILITGGTGTLGRAIVKHLLTFSDIAIRVLARNEFQHWQMQQEITDKRVRHLIGDIRDKGRVQMACRGADQIIHCAAMKHVSFCEYNPLEAVKTNVEGTANVIEAAIQCDVTKVLTVSSDKAVMPINLYGATKLTAEKLTLSGTAYGSDTMFAVARLVNFYGSSGSVIPKWQTQKESGIIDVTSPLASRYWITIERAAHFTVDCLNMMTGGEIFIPKCQSMTLKELARQIAPEAEQRIIGLRQGEKVVEDLFTEEEGTKMQDCGHYWVIR